MFSDFKDAEMRLTICVIPFGKILPSLDQYTDRAVRDRPICNRLKKLPGQTLDEATRVSTGTILITYKQVAMRRFFNIKKLIIL